MLFQPAAANSRRRNPLRLECLEDRCLLSYQVTDLGTLGGLYSVATGINNAGQVVGHSFLTGLSVDHAFLYDGSTLNDLGTLGGRDSAASAINNAGQVVGDSTTAEGSSHAFLYDANGMIDLGTLPGGGDSTATAINDAGQAVGYAAVSAIVVHAFLYDGGTLTDLGTLGGNLTRAFGINNLGQVVGSASTSSGTHAFFYDRGKMTDLGTLGSGSTLSWANAINDAGQVVGYANTADSFAHAFLYEQGRMRDLGTLGGGYSKALAIDSAGDVVGYSETIPGTSDLHAFLVSGGVMTDLSRLVADTGWILEAATGINDQGQIAGYGRNPTDHRSHGFLLTPDANPGTPGSPPSWVFAGTSQALAVPAPTMVTAPNVYADQIPSAGVVVDMAPTIGSESRTDRQPHALTLPSLERAEVDLNLNDRRWLPDHDQTPPI
jgi:probable HAF family extracellular repeat protein